jgi:hypothetical protein
MKPQITQITQMKKQYGENKKIVFVLVLCEIGEICGYIL